MYMESKTLRNLHIMKVIKRPKSNMRLTNVPPQLGGFGGIRPM